MNEKQATAFATANGVAVVKTTQPTTYKVGSFELVRAKRGGWRIAGQVWGPDRAGLAIEQCVRLEIKKRDNTEL